MAIRYARQCLAPKDTVKDTEARHRAQVEDTWYNYTVVAAHGHNVRSFTLAPVIDRLTRSCNGPGTFGAVRVLVPK